MLLYRYRKPESGSREDPASGNRRDTDGHDHPPRFHELTLGSRRCRNADSGPRALPGDSLRQLIVATPA